MMLNKVLCLLRKMFWSHDINYLRGYMYNCKLVESSKLEKAILLYFGSRYNVFWLSVTVLFSLG